MWLSNIACMKDLKCQKYLSIYLLTLVVINTCSLISCNSLKEKAKDTIHKTGETVGRGSSEFINGISEGVDYTFECKISVSNHLTSKGLRFGKFKIGNGPDATNNLLSIYLIFNQDIKDMVSVLVKDSKEQEYGRTKMTIEGKKGEAKYYDIIFDKRTNIESNSTFLLE